MKRSLLITFLILFGLILSPQSVIAQDDEEQDSFQVTQPPLPYPFFGDNRVD